MSAIEYVLLREQIIKALHLIKLGGEGSESSDNAIITSCCKLLLHWKQQHMVK